MNEHLEVFIEPLLRDTMRVPRNTTRVSIIGAHRVRAHRLEVRALADWAELLERTIPFGLAEQGF